MYHFIGVAIRGKSTRGQRAAPKRSKGVPLYRRRNPGEIDFGKISRFGSVFTERAVEVNGFRKELRGTKVSYRAERQKWLLEH